MSRVAPPRGSPFDGIKSAASKGAREVAGQVTQDGTAASDARCRLPGLTDRNPRLHFYISP